MAGCVRDEDMRWKIRFRFTLMVECCSGKCRGFIMQSIPFVQRQQKAQFKLKNVQSTGGIVNTTENNARNEIDDGGRWRNDIIKNIFPAERENSIS